MDRLKKLTADAVLVIQVLIVFVLFFESRIVLPAALQSFGRLHPLLLHLPIGLLLVTVALLFSRKYFEGHAVEKLGDVLLHFTALTTSLTTLMGLFLSLEGSFGAHQVSLHKWLGVSLSFLCWALLLVRNNVKVLKPLGLIGVSLLIFTGHYGGNLTHGEDFVWAPLRNEEPRVARVITDSTTLFTAAIEPIFEAKCYGCHNPKKAKGDLVLTTIEGIMKGGETGPLWLPEHAGQSLIIERLMLPLDHDDHMPPKDKAQLSEDEINFISLWIDSGANLKIKLKEVLPEDTLAVLASLIVPRYQQLETETQRYEFRFASPETIHKLSRPNRSVFQIARNEPAIQADFFLRETYEPRYLEELLEVKEQLISLNLSKMPVTDANLGVISKFINLEVLNLNNTAITGQGLELLNGLKKLRSLSLSGTTVDVNALARLGASESIREVFIWNTAVSTDDIEALKKRFPDVSWNIGFIPDDTEILKLNPPLLQNKSQVLNPGEKVILKHSLPGAQMRYTLDRTKPDSVNSPTFNEGLDVASYAVITARAFKEGWHSSDVAEFFFFRKGFKPDTAFLETSPHETYPGEGIITLFDGKQGLPDFYRHPAWMAFKEDNLVLRFSFNKDRPIVSNVTLSFANNRYALCMPPDKMELWGGDDPTKLQLVARLDPPETEGPSKPRIEGFSLDIPPSKFKHYKLIARPAQNPKDSNPQRRHLWLMVDEVFLN